MALLPDRRDFLKHTLAVTAGWWLARPAWAATQVPSIPHPLGVFPRKQLPVPILPADPDAIRLYWRAWELAWDRITASPGAPQSPYMDEAANPNRIWIWDTCFMSLFCRYAPTLYPGIESLDNFYAPLHDHAESPLTIRHWDNPPLFAWIELEHFRHTGDLARVRWLLEEKHYLQKHFSFFEDTPTNIPPALETDVVARREGIGYLWSGNPSGMDNTPRGAGDYASIYWIDALAQQALAARCITELAHAIERDDIAAEYEKEFAARVELLNQHYWDPTDRFYYDIGSGVPHDFCKVRTPASYWAMLAGACTDDQAEAMRDHAVDPAWFGGPFPWPTVTADSEWFSPQGYYWRGGIWLPTAYMGIKALERHGFHADARELSSRLLRQMIVTEREFSPHTIWECYSPTANEPSTKKDNRNLVRRDFCGWSALGPISLLIENIIGIHRIDALNREVHWAKSRDDRHGVHGLRIGDITADLEAEGRSATVRTSAPFTLIINGQSYALHAGENRLDLA